MSIGIYMQADLVRPNQGYYRIIGGFESAQLDTDFTFDLWTLASVDALLAMGDGSDNGVAFFFTCDVVIISDISDAVNLQSYGGLPGKYRLGEVQFFEGDTVSDTRYVNFLSHNVGVVSFFAGAIGRQGFYQSAPFLPAEVNDILTPPDRDYLHLWRSWDGYYGNVRCHPLNGVKMKVVASYCGTKVYRRRAPRPPLVDVFKS